MARARDPIESFTHGARTRHVPAPHVTVRSCA